MKVSYKKTIFLVVLNICLVLTGCGVPKSPDSGADPAARAQAESNALTSTTSVTENAAPDFTAATNQDVDFTLSEQSDKVVLLNFWATWCGPCVGEMPAFEKLFQEYGEELSILAVNCQEDRESVDSFISENDYTFPIAYDEDGDVCSKYPTDGIPYTLVIGKDGAIKQTFLGARGADEQYELYKEAIEAALQE